MFPRMTPTTSAARSLEAAPNSDAGPSAPPGPTPAGRRALVKSEDWVAAWLGLAIIALVLAGVRPEIPRFKWATDSAVASTVVAKKAALDALALDAAARAEPQLAAAAASLKVAADSGDLHAQLLGARVRHLRPRHRPVRQQRDRPPRMAPGCGPDRVLHQDGPRHPRVEHPLPRDRAGGRSRDRPGAAGGLGGLVFLLLAREEAEGGRGARRHALHGGVDLRGV